MAVFFVTASGCKKYLEEDVKGSLLGAGVLKSQQGLEAAFMGAYAGWENTFRTGFIHSTAIAATMGGNDITRHHASNKAKLREFDQFAVSASY